MPPLRDRVVLLWHFLENGEVSGFAKEKLRERGGMEGCNGLIIFIDETDPSDPTRREEFWRTKFKSLAHYSLNVG